MRFFVKFSVFILLCISCSSYMAMIPELSSLTLDEKIGQCLMIAAVSEPSINTLFMAVSPYTFDTGYIEAMVRDYHVGGVIFLGAGTPEAQVHVTKQLQSIARYPLLIGLDAEWGLSMRHRSGVVRFPRAMTLGALSADDDPLIEALGYEIGRQCKQLGVHINFAPVADVNNNEKNPVINTRSFGEDPAKVAHKAALFMRGMQQAGILTCAKHFPGHGDTTIDTHHGRGVVPHDRAHLDAVELVPFKQLINNGVDAIMTAHLDVPALSGGERIPATVSRDIITKLLRDEYGFEGLIITDGLGMRGVADTYARGDLELRALQAGNDILLCPVNVPMAAASIKRALETGELNQAELDVHVERILRAKRNVRDAQEKLAIETLINPEALDLKKRLYQAAITVARDDRQRIPYPPDNVIHLCSFGNSAHFAQLLREHFQVQEVPNQLMADKVDHLVIAVHIDHGSGMIEMQQQTHAHAMSEAIEWAQRYADKSTLILFGNPYNLRHFKAPPTIIVGYENEPEAHTAVVGVLRGALEARGCLPVKLK